MEKKHIPKSVGACPIHVNWRPIKSMRGTFIHEKAHLLLYTCHRKRGGDLPCERWHLPPLVHSSLPAIISKISNTWQIRPPWGLLSFFLLKRGFLPHLEGSRELLFL